MPNLTLGPPVVKWIRRHCDLYLDCHLMMDNPGQYLGAFRGDVGADSCTVHVEVGGTGGADRSDAWAGARGRLGGEPGDGFRSLTGPTSATGP